MIAETVIPFVLVLAALSFYTLILAAVFGGSSWRRGFDEGFESGRAAERLRSTSNVRRIS